MGFFQKIRNALYRFMYGRNGMDQLNRAMLIAYLVLWFVQLIVAAVLKSDLITSICSALMWALMVFIIFRMFSRNLYKRREENQKWMSWWWKLRNDQAGARARHADKDHKYFTCKNCKAICRVPAGKGKIIITCPKCGAQIHGRS